MLPSASPLEKSYCVKVHKTLGSGADGTVIRGVVLAGDRVGEWHALKFMSNSAYCMQREVETLRRVTPHPNIIELVGVFHAQKQIVLAFPELDCSLQENLGRRRRVVSPSLATHVALQLLDAAAHMHHVHVLHRDIKPQNILVEFGSSSCPHAELSVKLADFSRARELPRYSGEEPPGMCAVDNDGMAAMTVGVATPMYSAPEVLFAPWSGTTMYGTASDMWSVGAVCFELMDGQVLAYGASDARHVASIICRLGPCPENLTLGPRQAMLLQAAHDQVPLLESHFPMLAICRLPGSAGRVLVEGALRWNPEARPTAVEMKHLVEQQQLAEEKPAGELSETYLATTQEIKSKTDQHVVPEVLGVTEAGSVTTQEKQTKLDTHVASEIMGRFATSMQPVQTKRSRTQTCQCSGHCYQPGHRYHKGCDSHDLVVGTNYCTGCKCMLRGCMIPRHQGSLCSGHTRAMSQLPWELQAAHTCREFALDMMPCDIVDFVGLWPEIRPHPLLAIVAAMLKEPWATQHWLKTGFLQQCAAGKFKHDCQAFARAMHVSLSAVVEASDGCPNREEVDQLSRQGPSYVTPTFALCDSDVAACECFRGRQFWLPSS